MALDSLEIPADGVGEYPDPPLDVREHGDDGGGEDEPLPGERIGQQLEDRPLKGERFFHLFSFVLRDLSNSFALRVRLSFLCMRARFATFSQFLATYLTFKLSPFQILQAGFRGLQLLKLQISVAYLIAALG